jgi:hypothetical protein
MVSQRDNFSSGYNDRFSPLYLLLAHAPYASSSHSMASSAQILPVGAGYGVVIGVGFFFAFVSVSNSLHSPNTDISLGDDGHLSPPEQIHSVQHQYQRGV